MASVRKDRQGSRGGGVSAFIKHCWNVVSVKCDNDFDDNELSCFDCVMSHSRIRCFVIYRPPTTGQDAEQYMTKLVKCLNKCRIPGVQLHLSPKFAHKELVWDSFASSVGLSVLGFRSSEPKVKIQLSPRLKVEIHRNLI